MDAVKARIPAAVCALVVLVLGGCTAPPKPTQTPPATATETATPEPAPAVAVPALGGECANMIDLAEVDALTGDVGAQFPGSGSPAVSALVLGGLACVVFQERSGLAATVLPSSVIPATPEFAEVSSCVETPEPLCTVIMVSGDTWIEVRVDSYSLQAQPDPVGALTAFAARIADRAAQYPAPVAAEPGDTWWASPPECDVLFSESGLAAVLGPTFEPGYPGHGFTAPLWAGLLESRGQFRACDWYQGLGRDEGHPHTVRIVALAGSAATLEQFAAESGGTVEPIIVPGADQAVLALVALPTGGQDVVVVASIGDNLLKVTTRELSDSAPTDVEETVSIAAALFARLDQR